MSELQLKRISKEIIERAEQAVIPPKGLDKAVDDYFIQHLKQEEMAHADVDSRHLEALRSMVKSEILPLYGQFRLDTAPFRTRRERRELWRYVLGTVGVCEILEAILTRGRSIVPTVLIPTAILYSFIGFILYTAAQYLDELQIRRARKKLERSIAELERRVQTDSDYDHRRQLLDSDVLRAEAVEILTGYQNATDFWRDYVRIRQADPTVPTELKVLNAPAFDRFLRFHVDGQYSSIARQHRFDRLFIEAHEALLSRDREHYVMDHLKGIRDT